jgi:hypothetical protein
MKLSKTILAVLGTAVLGLMSQSAQAVPINGSIGFNGNGFGSQGAGGSPSTLTFNNPMTVDSLFRFGDYSGVPAGTAVNFAPITWTGSGTSAMLTSLNSPEWSFTTGGTTYSFNLLSLTSATMNGGAVSLQGTGVAFISGAINRDPTFATFSVQGTGNNFSFQIIQASNSVAGVPDGGSAIALLGMGVMGLEFLRRKLRA